MDHQVRELGLERGVVLGVGVGRLEIENERHQRLGDEAAAEDAEMPALVGAGAVAVELAVVGRLRECHAAASSGLVGAGPAIRLPA